MAAKWVLLQAAPSVNAQDFTLKQIGLELRSQEIPFAICNVLDKQGNDRLPKTVFDEIASFMPTHIIWNGALTWRYWDVIKKFTAAKKIALFFDDPFTPSERLGVVPAIQEGALAGVSIYCWDTYWSAEMLHNWGIAPQQINLAALSNEYYKADYTLTDDLVFIGNLHSNLELSRSAEALPKIFADCYKEALGVIKTRISLPCASKMIREIVDSWADGKKRLWQDLIKRNGSHLHSLKWNVWAKSKNEVRERMLRTVVRKGLPLRIFCETKQLHHMGVDEYRYVIGDFDHKVKLHDSSMYPSHELGQLYHYGKLHLQATDPQSMWTGIPYRAFQCAASARPLLTDIKPEWNTAFEYETEIIPYSDGGFEEKLEEVISRPIDYFRDIGENAYRKFNLSHTWKHRLSQFTQEDKTYNAPDPFQDLITKGIL